MNNLTDYFREKILDGKADLYKCGDLERLCKVNLKIKLLKIRKGKVTAIFSLCDEKGEDVFIIKQLEGWENTSIYIEDMAILLPIILKPA